MFFAEQKFFAALCFALASFKVIPLILAIFVLLSKDWRLFRSYCVCCTLLFLAPFFYFGLETGKQQWLDFYHLAYIHKITCKEISSYPIQSLWGAISRLFPLLSDTTLPVIVALLFLVFLGIILWKYGSGKVLQNDLDRYRLMAMLSTAMLLFSPDARTSHFSILAFPVLLLVWGAFLESRWGAARILTLLVLVTNIFYSTDLVGRKINSIAQSLSLYTWLMLSFIFYFFPTNKPLREEDQPGNDAQKKKCDLADPHLSS